MDADGFIVVKSAKRGRKIPQKKVNTNIYEKETIDVESTLKKIESAKSDLIGTEFMDNVIEDVNEIHNKENILGLHCYGIGQLSTVISRYQTAFLLILKDKLRIKDEDTLVFDPVFGDDEHTLLKKLGLTPTTKNTHCNVRIEEKTLVFLPHCPKELTNNLLYTNLVNSGAGSTISNIALISNSISNVLLRTPESKIKTRANILKIAADSGLIGEANINNSFKFTDIFNDLAVHTFTNPVDDVLKGVPQPVYEDEDAELI